MPPVDVASFYRFADVDGPDAVADRLRVFCRKKELLGTVLIAGEGINGTLAGSRQNIVDVLHWIQERLSLAEAVEARWTQAEAAPFRRMRVKVKSEIVTLGRPDIRPDRKTGRHVDANAWNGLLDQPDTLVIDTRNHYEYELGSFDGAVDPNTDSFRDFPAYAAELAKEDRDRPVAMFCTGGIRCEKATALMIELGFENVYQLQGGILKYLEDTAEADSRWNGECFVFDTRVAVDRDRAEGGYVQCHACRRPLSSEDLKSKDYREGVSCPRCIDSLDKDRAARLEERRRQVKLAKERGDAHIGQRLDDE